MVNRVMCLKKYAAFIILPVILLFSSIVGFTPSVIRAGLMLSISLIAFLFKKDYDSLTSLFVSGLIMLLVNPYTLFNIGFILSFFATYSIIVLYPVIKEIIYLTKESIKCDIISVGCLCGLSYKNNKYSILGTIFIGFSSKTINI